MYNCELCNKQMYEKSSMFTDNGFVVCIQCYDYYDDKELAEKINIKESKMENQI